MRITKVDDYVDALLIMFPEVSKEDIKRIISYGWRQYYLLNSFGGDVLVMDDEFFSYTGKLSADSLKHFIHYKRMLIIKLRVLYKRKKVKWDGYYYFALTDELYENYLNLKKSRGRPRKKFKFGDIALYKIHDECKVNLWKGTHIFRIPYIVDIGYKKILKDFISDKAEYLYSRPIPTFKDILVTENKYEYL